MGGGGVDGGGRCLLLLGCAGAALRCCDSRCRVPCTFSSTSLSLTKYGQLGAGQVPGFAEHGETTRLRVPCACIMSLTAA